MIPQFVPTRNAREASAVQLPGQQGENLLRAPVTERLRRLGVLVSGGAMTAGETWDSCIKEIENLPSVKKYAKDVKVTMYMAGEIQHLRDDFILLPADVPGKGRRGDCLPVQPE